MTYKHTLIIGAAILIAGCQTTPEPEPEEIIVDPVSIQTCTPISKLTKVDVPAETQTYTAIVMIDNPPYAPIERREEQVRVIKEAQVIYVDSEGKEVLDICNEEVQPATEETEAPTDG